MEEFATPSQALLEEPELNEHFRRKHNFPWDRVPIKMSFFVGIDQVPNCATLRTMASREGKRLGRVFRVMDHGSRYEVCYYADREGGPVEPKKPGRKPIEEHKKRGPKTDLITPDAKLLHYKFDCHACAAKNNQQGVMFRFFEENDTQVRMNCVGCGMWNVLDKSAGTLELQPDNEPRFFKD